MFKQDRSFELTERMDMRVKIMFSLFQLETSHRWESAHHTRPNRISGRRQQELFPPWEAVFSSEMIQTFLFYTAGFGSS